MLFTKLSLYSTIILIPVLFYSALNFSTHPQLYDSYQEYEIYESALIPATAPIPSTSVASVAAYDISSYVDLDAKHIYEATHKTITTEVRVQQSAPNPSLSVQETLTQQPQQVESYTSAERGASYLVAEPETPPQWNGSIPEYYGTGTGCTQEQATIVANIMWAKGASDDTVTWMLKTMSRESTCDSSVVNDNPRTSDNSWGLCQLNVLSGHFGSNGILNGWDRYRFAYDFVYNVEACVHLWTVCGRGPWNYGNYYCSKPSELSLSD